MESPADPVRARSSSDVHDHEDRSEDNDQTSIPPAATEAGIAMSEDEMRGASMEHHESNAWKSEARQQLHALLGEPLMIRARSLTAGERLYVADLVNRHKLPKEYIARHIGISSQSVATYATQALQIPNPFAGVTPRCPTSRDAPAGMPDDPWKGQEVDMKSQKLNLEQQKYIAALINVKGQDLRTVSKRFNLTDSFVSRTARRLRKEEGTEVYQVASGKVLVTVHDSERYSRMRNALLDDLSLQVLAARARAGIKRADMKELILDEVAQTDSRRPHDKPPLDVKTRQQLAGSETVRRYLRKYKPYVG